MSVFRMIAVCGFCAITGFAQGTQVAPDGVRAPADGPLRLSMRQALDLATSSEGSLAVQISDRAKNTAKAKTGQAFSALMPQVNGTGNFQDFNRSFGAIGLTAVQLPFGLRVPQRIDPITTMDARGQVTGNLFSMSAIRQYQTAGAGEKLAAAESNNVRQKVAAEVARQYAIALRAAAQVDAIQANITLAQAVYDQAKRNDENGIGTSLEITRAEFDLTAQKQRLIAAQNEVTRANLSLLRAMGRSLETPVVLTDTLKYTPIETQALNALLAQADKTRADLEAQRQREEVAKKALSAVKAESLPSVVGFADYGTTGNIAQSIQPTRTVGLALNVPLWDGGRRRARASELAEQLSIEQLKTRDLRESIELESRVELNALQAAVEQVNTAEAGLRLAESESTQAQRRYQAGVGTSLEVTTSQARLALARDNRVAALFNHTMVRIELYNTLGILMEMIQ